MNWLKIRNYTFLIIIVCSHIIAYSVYLRDFLSSSINISFFTRTLVVATLLLIMFMKSKIKKTIISFFLFIYFYLDRILVNLYTMIVYHEHSLNTAIIYVIYELIFVIIVLYFMMSNFRFLKVIMCLYFFINIISVVSVFSSHFSFLLLFGQRMYTIFLYLFLFNNINFSPFMSLKKELKYINARKKKSKISEEEYLTKRKIIIDLI